MVDATPSLSRDERIAAYMEDPDLLADLVADRVDGRLVDREAIDLEAVAAVEHDQWAHWTAYMLDNMTDVNIARWRQQIECLYSALTEKEKDSDREWAHKAINAAIGDKGEGSIAMLTDQ